MADDRDFYDDTADHEPSTGTIHVLRSIEGETGDEQIRRFAALVPPPPKLTHSQFLGRLRAEWAALATQGDADKIAEQGNDEGDDEIHGWPIREDPSTPDAAANEKKESQK